MASRLGRLMDLAGKYAHIDCRFSIPGENRITLPKLNKMNIHSRYKDINQIETHTMKVIEHDYNLT